MKYIGKKDIFIVTYYLGKIMQGAGIAILLPIIVALIYQEHIYYLGFIIPAAISIGLGTFLCRNTPKYKRVQLKHGMIVSSLAWLWVALLGASVMMICLDISFIDALFENMSTWTGSGLTVFIDVEVLPKSILFLRSLEQWIGGLGVVVIMIGILIHAGTAASRLYKSEAREDRIKPSVANTLKKILQIYLIYTVLGIILFLLAGMPVFDAINNTFSLIATGGMSIKNANMGFYNDYIFYIIAMFLMILGATSFMTHYRAIKTNGIAIFKDLEFKAMVLLIAASSIILILITNVLPIDIIYSVVSAVTTTGSSITSPTDNATWPGILKVVIIGLMFIGGSSGSTVGAVKIIRIITSLKGIHKNILNIISPEGRVMNMKIANKQLKEPQITEAGSYISLYLVFILIGWGVLVFYGYDSMNALFEIVSAQGNVGLNTGIANAALPLYAKLVVIFNMWIGRLEIIPVLILIRSVFEVFRRIIPFS